VRTGSFKDALMSALVVASLMMLVILSIFASQVSAEGLTPRSPIYIDGNDGFTPANGVTSGSGTAEDPYILENWDISTANAHGIEIRNSSAYFVIRNCHVHDGMVGGHYGIYFNDVTNGKVENSIAENNSSGIYLYRSNNNIIINSTMQNNVIDIEFYFSSYNLIENCTSDTRIGPYSNNNTITNCTGGVRCSSDSEVTIHGSNLTIGLDIGLTRSGVVEELKDLKGRDHNDNTFIVDNARLRLINTFVRHWYPRVHGDSRLTVSDTHGWFSIQGSTGNSQVTIKNCGTMTVEAAEEVEVTVLNSAIHTNVVAKENSKIWIDDSWISHGGLMAHGNGEIHVNSSEVDASFLEADDNSIIKLTNSNVPPDIRMRNSGKAYVYWTLTVLVTIDNQPQQNAAITVKWPDGKLAASGTTGQGGSATFTLINRIITETGTASFNNYTIAASYHDHAGEQNIELDGSKTVAIELKKTRPNYLLILTFIFLSSTAVILWYIQLRRKKRKGKSLISQFSQILKYKPASEIVGSFPINS